MYYKTRQNSWFYAICPDGFSFGFYLFNGRTTVVILLNFSVQPDILL